MLIRFTVKFPSNVNLLFKACLYVCFIQVQLTVSNTHPFNHSTESCSSSVLRLIYVVKCKSDLVLICIAVLQMSITMHMVVGPYTLYTLVSKGVGRLRLLLSLKTKHGIKKYSVSPRSYLCCIYLHKNHTCVYIKIQDVVSSIQYTILLNFLYRGALSTGNIPCGGSTLISNKKWNRTIGIRKGAGTLETLCGCHGA